MLEQGKSGRELEVRIFSSSPSLLVSSSCLLYFSLKIRSKGCTWGRSRTWSRWGVQGKGREEGGAMGGRGREHGCGEQGRAGRLW
jgi:hypothetical protein